MPFQRAFSGLQNRLLPSSIAGTAAYLPRPWLWLKQPHGTLDGETPLAVLKARGGRSRVKEVAGRDFA